MLNKVFAFFLLILCLNKAFAQNDVVNDDEKSSFNLNKPEREQWLKNTGAGLFIHFSVDAQLGVVISHSLVGASDDYVDRFFTELPKTFNPDKFDPYQIAVLAKLAGMKYIVFTTKHHSGFCMWDTKTTDFNITKTPYKKDLLKQFVDATRAVGLDVGLYFSPEDFYFLHANHLPISRTNVVMDAALTKKYADYNRRQCEELMTNYGKIDVLFIDGEPKEVVKQTCWKLQPDLLITRGAIKTPEQTLPGTPITQPWLSPITIGTAWQYQPTNERYKSGSQLINLLVEARSKGGSLLLNVGPKPNGELAEEQDGRLREMAAWYFINHECIDSVKTWVINKENNILFTAKGDAVYAIVTEAAEWKEGERKTFTLHSVKAQSNTVVNVLGQNSKIMEYKPNADVSCKYKQTASGLEVSVVKAQRIYDDHRWPNAVVIKLDHVLPAITEAVTVETDDAKPAGTGFLLSGRLYDFKNKNVKRARFAYRAYRGRVETLYADQWKYTDWVNVSPEGRFNTTIKTASGSFEYKAVAEQSKVDVEGDTKLLN
ncbi:alpha-L-fucosidase [Mucilaginibacter paludis]|uniref:alpha-L-fucosidase n=1 Tax=Mucilaginibacter paludis DSM 18603 TaxID=714943 RepID=H1Y8C8_9SPHI|nr:alpha-L-fucosidase [Mucilaginibacter paludis]EHQ24947.1 glycoside hydrolase family 29 (alpha-L-fucosidase) [Mucilaginibacter paludis DSM 18603]